MAADLQSMMWAPAPSTGASTGGTGLQNLANMGSAPVVGVAGSGGSPILSSPPSSNASSSSTQNYSAGYELMVPPTVPSHSMVTETVSNGNGASNTLFDLQQACSSPSKAECAAEPRGCSGFPAHAYPAYAEAHPQLTDWNGSSHTSAYVSSSPTPPPPVPQTQSFPFDPWQPASASHNA